MIAYRNFLSYGIIHLQIMLIQTGWSIGGAGGGMAIGVFTLGMLVPWTNAIVTLIIIFR